MKRRDVLKSLPVMVLGPPALSEALAGPHTAERAFASTLDPVPQAASDTQVSLLVIGLWLLGFDNLLNAYVLASMNSAGVEVPDGDHVHMHYPFLILPNDAVDSTAGGDPVVLADRKKWPWLPAGDFLKFPLSGEFFVHGMDQPSGESVLGAFPVALVNSYCDPDNETERLKCEVRPNWYTKADIATSYLRLRGGRIEDAPSRKGVKVGWSFDDDYTTSNTQVRLTDTLELKGSGSDVEILAPGKLNKAALPAINGFLANLPDDVTPAERKNKRVLYHTRAFYKVFRAQDIPGKLRIPRTRAVTYPGGEPVFCPPGTLL